MVAVMPFYAPETGTLSGVPDNWRALLAHLGLYALAGGLFLLLLLDGVLPVAYQWQFRLGALAAVLLPVLPLLALADLIGMLIARRWGRTPDAKIVFGFIVVVSAFGLPICWSVSTEVLEYLTNERDFWSPIEETLWASPVAVLVHGLAVWIRHAFVSRWRQAVEQAQRESREAQLGRQLAEAQLAMLQAQIEPHFLYNTLASIRYVVDRDSRTAGFLLDQLTRYLRHAMPKLRQTMSTLAQEFELADAFLQIARVRMGGRLRVEVELPEALHAVPFPPLVLQTLVENALKHGVEPKTGPARIEVTARQVADEIVLQVIDDGIGIGGSRRTAGSGTGLPNVRARLEGIYGDRAQLSVVGGAGGGVVSTVALTLPEGTPRAPN